MHLFSLLNTINKNISSFLLFSSSFLSLFQVISWKQLYRILSIHKFVNYVDEISVQADSSMFSQTFIWKSASPEVDSFVGLYCVCAEPRGPLLPAFTVCTQREVITSWDLQRFLMGISFNIHSNNQTEGKKRLGGGRKINHKRRNGEEKEDTRRVESVH